MAWLVAAFFAVAVLYASVGFGGGSSYAAMLALAGVEFRVLPVIALVCNIVVVAGGTIRFARARLVPWRRAAVLVALAAPTALLGGLTPIGEAQFMAVLGASLVLTAGALVWPIPNRVASARVDARIVTLAAAPLGYLAGLVGIGGGIFLAPLLHLTGWAKARSVAATASLFILVNSVFGLAGHVWKGGTDSLALAFALGLPLILAVVVGGQIGSLLAARLLPEHWIRRVTAILVGAVGIRLLWL